MIVIRVNLQSSPILCRSAQNKYEKDRVTADEFPVWEDEQAWGDE
jgi:hypothetical protein